MKITKSQLQRIIKEYNQPDPRDAWEAIREDLERFILEMGSSDMDFDHDTKRAIKDGILGIVEELLQGQW